MPEPRPVEPEPCQTPRPHPPRLFPNVVGLELEEVRIDYGRMRLPFRSELNQPAGMVHGGAIATLIDTVVVPAIGSAYDDFMVMLTIDLQIRIPSRPFDRVLSGRGARG